MFDTSRPWLFQVEGWLEWPKAGYWQNSGFVVELLRRNREEQLSADEEEELDRLLEQVDYMNVLKARAMYTLQQRGLSS